MAAVSLGFALAAVELGYYGKWGGWGWSGGEFLPSEINQKVGVPGAPALSIRDGTSKSPSRLRALRVDPRCSALLM